MIAFRSRFHLYWFLGSVAAACALISAALLTGYGPPLVGGLAAHLCTTVNASVHVRRHGEGRAYSRTCVWFNGAMAMLYLAAIFLLRKQ